MPEKLPDIEIIMAQYSVEDQFGRAISLETIHDNKLDGLPSEVLEAGTVKAYKKIGRSKIRSYLKQFQGNHEDIVRIATKIAWLRIEADMLEAATKEHISQMNRSRPSQ